MANKKDKKIYMYALIYTDRVYDKEGYSAKEYHDCYSRARQDVLAVPEIVAVLIYSNQDTAMVIKRHFFEDTKVSLAQI